MTEVRKEEDKDEHSGSEGTPFQPLKFQRIHLVLAQFYLMLEGQLILLAESTDSSAPGYQPRQFHLVPEGQLILLTESTDNSAPGYQPRQFHLVPEGQLILLTESTENLAPGYQPRQFILMQEGTTGRADSASRSP